MALEFTKSDEAARELFTDLEVNYNLPQEQLKAIEQHINKFRLTLINDVETRINKNISLLLAAAASY